MNNKLLLLLFVWTSLPVFSQAGGDFTYQFLNLSPSPRQAALGGKLVSNWDSDVNQAFYNPAAINPQMDRQLSVNFGKYLGEVNYGTAAYSRSFDSQKNFFIGVQFAHYGSFEGYDESGISTGEFSGSEVALSLGYSYDFAQSNWYVGASAKMISSHLETYNSFGLALDLGLIYADPDSKWNFGLSLRNLGAQLATYQDQREQLPVDLMVSISKELENVPIRWHVSLDQFQQWNLSFANPNRGTTDLNGELKQENPGFFNNALRHLIVGAELFPGRNFNLRLGYNFRRGEELRILDQRHFAGITAGFGFKYNKLRFDYAYSRYSIAANSSFFGVTVDLQ